MPATMAPTLQVPVQPASVAEAATFTYQLPGAVPAGTFTATCTAAGTNRVLAPNYPVRHLPGETDRWSTIIQIYEGTNQIQRVVMARQLIK